MIAFKQLLGVMRKRKRKLLYASLIAEAVIMLTTILGFGFSMHWSVKGKITTITILAVIMLLDMIAYAILAIYQAYKINRSQTWRAIPADSKLFVNANALSTGLGIFWQWFLSWAMMLVYVLPVSRSLVTNADFQSSVGDFTKTGGQMPGFLLELAVLGFFGAIEMTYYWLLVTDLSGALVDHLPVGPKAAKTLKEVIVFLLVILFSWISGHVGSSLMDASAQTADSIFVILGMLILEQIINCLIAGSAETWIFDKYVESQK